MNTAIERRTFLRGLAVMGGLSAASTGSTVRAQVSSVTTESLLELLQELISAVGPCGHEDEVREISLRELEPLCDDVWVDEAGNVVGVVRGRDGTLENSTEKPILRVMAHMDETGMIVKRVNADGTLRVQNMGGIHPPNIGQGPVDILADTGIIPGIHSLGPMHSSPETGNVEATRTQDMDWSHVWVFTRKSPAELGRAGVHTGTKVAIARARRTLFPVGDCVGGYFMDDRAPMAIAIGAARLLKASGQRPANDVYFVMTVEEEIGAIGAAWAANTLPGDMTLAIDVGPVAAEYGTALTREPVVAWGNGSQIYSRSVSDRLMAITKGLGMQPQTGLWSRYGSDASITKQYGHTARSGLLCIATQNTHGYEIIQREGLLACARVLEEFCREPVGR